MRAKGSSTGGAPEYTEVTATLIRKDGGSGSTSVWGSLPFTPGLVATEADLENVRVFNSVGVEQAIAIAPTRGRHNVAAGGLRSAVFRFVRTYSDGEAGTWTIRINDPAGRGTTDLTYVGVTQAEIIQPCALVINDPDYLCDTLCTLQPLLPASLQNAAETAWFDTHFDSGVTTLMDARWAEYNIVDGTGTQQWNLDQTAGYQVARAYLGKWCRTGEVMYWYRAMRHIANVYSVYNADLPAEQWGPFYFDLGITYILTGNLDFWGTTGRCAVHTGGIDRGEALYFGTEATAKDYHLTPNGYGARYNLRSKWCAITAACIDAKSASFFREPVFATEMPWIVDTNEDSVYDVPGYECLDGMILQNTTYVGDFTLNFPIFWTIFPIQWLMDYYTNIKADARIPGLIKGVVDMFWGQVNTLAGPTYGIGYNIQCPKDPAGNDTLLMGMMSAATAFTAAFYDTGGSTVYYDLYLKTMLPANLPLGGGWSSNTTKIGGENYGFSQSAPYYRAMGQPTVVPAVIREPTSY